MFANIFKELIRSFVKYKYSEVVISKERPELILFHQVPHVCQIDLQKLLYFTQFSHAIM